MTDIKKTAENKGPAQAKKLQLNKETLKDLSAKGGGQVRGGGTNQSGGGNTCSRQCP